MIIDNLHTSLCDYGNMDVRLAKAFDWLKATDLKALAPDQAIVIDGNRVKAQIQAYETIKPETGSFETHRSYIDIQIMVEGQEIMYWAPMSELTAIKTPYNFEKDLVFFEEPKHKIPMLFREGDFAVFFPTDGHKPRCQAAGKAEKVKKIVVKVAV